MLMMTKQMLHWIRFLLDPSRMAEYLYREDVARCLSFTREKKKKGMKRKERRLILFKQ